MITLVRENEIMTASVAATFMDGDSEMMLVKVGNRVNGAMPVAQPKMQAPRFKAKMPKKLVSREMIEAAAEAPVVVPKKRGIKGKPVICTNTEMLFEDAKSAAAALIPEGALQWNTTKIRECCAGKRESVNGLHFVYAEAAN